MLIPEKGVRAMANGQWRMASRRRLLCKVADIVSPQTAGTHCSHSGHRGVCGVPLVDEQGKLHALGCKLGGGVVACHNGIRDVLWKFIREFIDPCALREQRLESLRGGDLEDADPDDDPADVLDVVFNFDGRRISIDVAVVGANTDPACETHSA